MKYPIKCFLIDDDEDDQEIFGMALQDLDPGIQLDSAMSCQKALAKLKSDRSYIPSCIFIDLNMPIWDGKECLAEIKKMEWLRKVPVFMYSTLADPKIVQYTKAHGAVDFIVKPVNITQLTDTLRTILK